LQSKAIHTRAENQVITRFLAICMSMTPKTSYRPQKYGLIFPRTE